MIESFAIGILSGFAASLCFIVFLYQLRPKIAISPEIGKRTVAGGTPLYTFKIINHSPYPIIDLRIELTLNTPRNIANGTITDQVKLGNTERFELDARGGSPEDRYGNEFWFTYRDDIEQLWDDNSQHIVLHVYARHSLSQFSRTFSHRFNRKALCIKQGQHINGTSLAVAVEA